MARCRTTAPSPCPGDPTPCARASAWSIAPRTTAGARTATRCARRPTPDSRSVPGPLAWRGRGRGASRDRRRQRVRRRTHARATPSRRIRCECCRAPGSGVRFTSVVVFDLCLFSVVYHISILPSTTPVCITSFHHSSPSPVSITRIHSITRLHHSCLSPFSITLHYSVFHHPSLPPSFSTTILNYQSPSHVSTTRLHHPSPPPVSTTRLHHPSPPPVSTTRLHHPSQSTLHSFTTSSCLQVFTAPAPSRYNTSRHWNTVASFVLNAGLVVVMQCVQR